MTRTVDVVVAGVGAGVFDAAATALTRAPRVHVLLGSRDPRVARRLRRRLSDVARGSGAVCTVDAGTDVVCVDGIDGVEAVVFRYRRSGRLQAVNAGAFIAVPASCATASRRSRSSTAAAPSC